MTDIHLASAEQTSQQKPLVSIYCDLQNVYSIKNQANLLLAFAQSKGRIDWKSLYYNSQHQNQAFAKNHLEVLGFNCVDVPSHLKNSADNQLIVDCINRIAINPSPNIIILILGDRDFVGLICVLRSLGKKVIIFAQRGSASQTLIKLVGNDNFHFVDELPQLVGEKKQPQSTSVKVQINYNEAIKYLIEAIKTGLSQGKRTVLSCIDNLMRQRFPNYQGVSCIRTPDGKKFSRFSKFVDAVVKEGKVRMQNQELLLIE
jgi:NYN domain